MDDARVLAGMRYARLDDFWDDVPVRQEFQNCMETAEEYLSGFGLYRDRCNALRYDHVVNQIAAHMYDNRTAIADGAVSAIPVGARLMINQLKFTPRA